MIPKPIPEQFLVQQPLSRWQEILFGFEHGWIGRRTLSELARRHAERSSTTDQAVLELATLDKESGWKAVGLLKQLAGTESVEPEDVVRSKWLYIFLLWLYENSASFTDPFREVEELYADFGYPSEIESFVGFMPPSDGWNPKVHSKDENRARMLQHWMAYLERKNHLYRHEAIV